MTVRVNQARDLILGKNKVEIILDPIKVRNFSKSGAYIPLSGDYAGLWAYVIILKRMVKNDI